MESRKLLICGTRTYAEEVLDIASGVPGVEVVGFIENWERERANDTLEGLPIHWIDNVPKIAKGCVAVCALATTHRSKFTAQVEALGVPFTKLIHPAAHVSKRTKIGEGAIIGQGVIIGSNNVIGRHVIFGRGTLVGHHTHIGDHCTLFPGCNVAGNNRIGHAVYMGLGSIVINNLTVGAHSVIGAGAVVVKDVPANSQVVGVPARVVKENIEGK
jgi:sugar O-acyltransferase (sialic acid O-acetyltransferase NeuD family)